MTGRLYGVRTPGQLTILLFSLLILPACSRKKDKSHLLFQSLEESFTNCTALLNENTSRMITDLEKHRFEPTMYEDIGHWLPKATTIHVLSKNIVAYIEQLKSDLRKEAFLSNNDTLYCENAVTTFFQTNGKARELLNNLIEYRSIIMKMDRSIYEFLVYSEELNYWYFNATPDKTADFIMQFFDHVPVSAALTVLSKFQNDISVTENSLIRFCNDKCISRGWYFTSHTAIIAQNSTCVTTGEEIEIIAGVGAFSKAALPIVTIGGKITPIQSGGAAIYKFKTSDKPGKYSLPVTISFRDENGQEQKVARDIKYTVLAQSK